MDKETKEAKKSKKATFKRKIWVNASPKCDCGCTDETDEACADEDDKTSVETLTFEIPGVEKDRIHLDVTKDRVRMIAHRDSTTDFISEYVFACPAKLEEDPSAKYNNGILTLAVPVECPDPYKDALRLKIQ
jgi:HSP20 family molecular chaperone IbpA